MAVAHELRGLDQERTSVAVIGDGAITGGMAYEAMNNAAYLNSRIVVIYNDNGQVSLPTGTPSAGGTVPAGSLSAYTSRLIASKPFQDFRDIAKSINRLFPSEIQQANAKIDEYARGMVSGGTLFEELGFDSIGPVRCERRLFTPPAVNRSSDSTTSAPWTGTISTTSSRSSKTSATAAASSPSCCTSRLTKARATRPQRLRRTSTTACQSSTSRRARS